MQPRMALGLITFCLMIVVTPIHATDYPTRPITLIVPYPPGGTADVMARMTALAFFQHTGHEMVIDNRGGAGGNLAGGLVAQARPNGYTLIMGNAPMLSINPHLYAQVPFDPIKDFAPVIPVAEIPLFLIANQESAINSVQDLIEAAKADPGRLSFASGSNGSTTHLSMELFQTMTGVDMLHVPYKGSGPALVGVAAGEVPVMFELMPSALPMIESGKVKMLATTTAERTQEYPDVPTVSESGVPGFEMASWFGVLAPAGTDQAIIDYLHQSIAEATATDDFIARLDKIGALPMKGDPEAFSALIKTELDRWGEVVKVSGATVQ